MYGERKLDLVSLEYQIETLFESFPQNGTKEEVLFLLIVFGSIKNYVTQNF